MVRKRYGSLWVITLLVFTLISQATFAADGDHAADGKAAAAGRSTSELSLKNYVADFLWKAFPKLTRAQIVSRFENSLPVAMHDARLGDEANKQNDEKLIDLVVPLLGTFGDQKEVETLLKEITAAEKGEDERSIPDKDFLALLKRLKWAAGVLKGEPNEKFPDFNKRFDEKFTAYQGKQDEFWKKANCAANDSGETQKECVTFLAKNTDAGELKHFMDKFEPQAAESKDPKLKKWADNLKKVLPEVQKISPASTPLTEGTTGAKGSDGSGGVQPSPQAQAAPNGADLKAKLLAGGNCAQCHSSVSIDGNSWGNMTVRVTMMNGVQKQGNFSTMLAKANFMNFNADVVRMLQNWSAMK